MGRRGGRDGSERPIYGCRGKVDDSPTGGCMSQLIRNVPFARSQFSRSCTVRPTAARNPGQLSKRGGGSTTARERLDRIQRLHPAAFLARNPGADTPRTLPFAGDLRKFEPLAIYV